ncbi:MAG: hypothetical protein ABJC33_04680 [Betaproteobacteria bacterium]
MRSAWLPLEAPVGVPWALGGAAPPPWFAVLLPAGVLPLAGLAVSLPDVPAGAPLSAPFALVAAVELPVVDVFPGVPMLLEGEVAVPGPVAADVGSAAFAKPAPIMPIAGTIRPTINLRLK